MAAKLCYHFLTNCSKAIELCFVQWKHSYGIFSDQCSTWMNFIALFSMHVLVPSRSKLAMSVEGWRFPCHLEALGKGILRGWGRKQEELQFLSVWRKSNTENNKSTDLRMALYTTWDAGGGGKTLFYSMGRNSWWNPIKIKW